MTTSNRLTAKRYAVHKDEANGTWRICDLLHPDLAYITDPDFEIEDSHPAITILLDGQFTALFQEAVSLGFDIDRFTKMHEMKMLMEEENNFDIKEDNLDNVIIQPVEEKKEKGEWLTPVLGTTENNSENYGLSLKKLETLDKMMSTQNYDPEQIEKLAGLILRIGGNGDV